MTTGPAVLRLDAVGKRYLLREERSLLLGVLGRRAPAALWAVQDLTLEVLPGEVVAVVGRNGAGKSTVLKLAAGVTAPTTGTVRRTARVAPLIEVGAGFHPELTGRENVEVNARLLGLGRAAAREVFDDVVAFAELEHAVDRPVKEYSSGMFMRLGFAVAVHTAPELLVVDEVLAVGDLAFQSRCLDRIRRLRSEGAGVLFVSHNLGAVVELADRAVLLHEGRVRAAGSAGDVVAAYHASATPEPAGPGAGPAGQGRDLQVRSVRLEDGSEPDQVLLTSGARVRLAVELAAVRPVGAAVLGLRVRSETEGLVAGWHAAGASLPALAAGQQCTIVLSLTLNLTGGSYVLDLGAVSPDFDVVHLDAPGVARLSVAPDRLQSGTAHLAPVVEVRR